VSLSPRADRLRERFDQLAVDALVLTAPSDVRYLTGFSGEGWVVLAPETVLVTDGRYTLRAQREAPGLEVEVRTGAIHEPVARRIADRKAKRVGFQADHLTVAARDALQEKLDGSTLVPLKAVLREARMVKGPDELSALRRAIAVTDRVFGRMVERLAPGISEKLAALDVEQQILDAGGDRLAFESIVAFGPNAADPHAEPTHRKLRTRSLVKLDFGAEVRGYHADLTRTIFVGQPTRKFRDTYRIVLEAQQAAFAALRPGVPAKEVDQAARDVIVKAGHGDRFTHGLGHGVGLDIHEGPGIGQTSEDTVAAGMTVTIEPGIYLPGWGGVRIEDVVLVTEKGCRILTKAPKLKFD
jgi:Xaa-Pro aminopeptidase